MLKKILKGIGIVFLALIIIGVLFGEEPTESANAPSAQVAEKEQAEQPEPKQNQDELAKQEASTSNSSVPASAVAATAPAPAPVTGTLKVHFIDVGQADAILIQAPSGKSMLIDAGNNGDGSAVVGYVKDQGISKLDIVVGTHPHEDHIGGLDTVINSLDIGQVVMPAKTHTTTTFKDVLTAVQGKGLKITAAKPGVSLDLGSGVSTNVIAPIGSSYEDLNSFSAVIRLAFGNTSFLFTGDAESDSEADMVSSGAALSSTVLKVGHHGSTSSSSSGFLNKVKPTYTVIMVGKGNDYGHPHQETLTKLSNIGAKVFRTDLNGTIIATSDGSKVTFNTQPTEVKASTPAPAAPAPAAPPAPKPDPTPVKPSDNQSVTVYKTETGSKYHKDKCSSLSKSKIPISLKDAQAQNLGPCSKCNPPQ